jgi:hypothetical protein
MHPLLAETRDKLVKDIRWLVLGIPSDVSTHSKATGLKYSTEYFLHESTNAKRSYQHQNRAKLAYLVLSSPELETFIMETLAPKYAEQIVETAFSKDSSIKTEEENQAKNDAQIAIGKKVAAKVAKNGAKKKATRVPAKSSKKRAAKSAK